MDRVVAASPGSDADFSLGGSDRNECAARGTESLSRANHNRISWVVFDWVNQFVWVNEGKGFPRAG